MAKEIKGVLASRLIILLSIILVPISIFLIFIFVDFGLWFSNDPVLTFWIIKITCPSIFSAAWLFFLILFANRFAETIDSMDRMVGLIPLRLKIFYGINALFILFIFVFPMITPIIAILTFASLAWRLTTFRKKEWDGAGTPFYTKFLMVVFSLPALFCTVSIAPEYLELPLFLWVTIWVPLLDYIFTFSYALCTALAIGSLFILIANRGVAEYEQILTDPTKQKKFLYIRVLEFVLFIFFFLLSLYDFEVVDLFYNVGFFIVVFVSIVNYFSGKQQMKGFRSHVLGYILAAIFMGSNLIFFSLEISQILKFVSLVVLSAVFIGLFFYTFIHLDEDTF